MWQNFNTALSFLTIIRLPFAHQHLSTPQQLPASFPYFPLVGFILGACSLIVAATFSSFAPHPLPAIAVTATLAVLTRALHMDGLADMADALWGAYTPHRRLEIMKDSRIGAFGALALAFAVLTKVASIDLILRHGFLHVLLIVPVLSRTAMVLVAHRAPYARTEGGLAKPFLEHMTPRHLLQASILAGVLLLALTPRHVILFPLVAAACALVLKHVSLRALGGITGDVLGAVNELTELALFVTAACLPHH